MNSPSCRFSCVVAIAIVMVLGPIGLTRQSRAEDGPTLEETIDYIETKYSHCPDYALFEKYDDLKEGKLVNIIVRATSITITLSPTRWLVWRMEGVEIVNHEETRQKTRGTAELRVPLGELTTDVGVVESTDRGSPKLLLTCAKGKCLLVKRQFSSSELSWFSRLGLPVCNEVLTKVKTALVHAIKISGGKPELF